MGYGTFRERFWSQVDVGAPDECWEWTGTRNYKGGGYGRYWYRGRLWVAHRVAYLWETGTDPGELDVRHTCNNPPCVNPGHLTTEK